MKITKVSAIPMSAPVPLEKQHRTDLGTKVKSDATDRPGLGFTLRADALERFRYVDGPEFKF